MIPFTKMHGIGNDYIYINCLTGEIPDPAALSRRMSDRHFGIGSDGLILVLPSSIADFRMRMFNSDGSESGMCGNGIRCFAKYLFDRGLCGQMVSIESGGKVKHIEVIAENGTASGAVVDMGEPAVERSMVPMNGPEGRVINEPIIMKDGTVFNITCISMGNPHAVIYVDDVKNFPVGVYGPEIETNPLFPLRTNVEFVTVINDSEVIQRTWERGAGETLACGTGASAVCAAGVLTGKTKRTIVSHLSGGDLRLSWNEETNHLSMSGPAVEVFEGSWSA